MLILFTLFATKIVPVKWVESGTVLILSHMPLLFLPVTVGILNFLDVFSGKGILLVVVCLVSTLMVMISAGLTSQYLAQRKEKNDYIIGGKETTLHD